MRSRELWDEVQRIRGARGLAASHGDRVAVVNASGTEQVVELSYDAPNRRVVIRAGNAVPGQVPRPRATAITATSLTVAWDMPRTFGRPPITAYEVRYRTGGKAYVTAMRPAATPRLRAQDITDLASASYEIQVRAINSVGNGVWSPVLTVTPAA